MGQIIDDSLKGKRAEILRVTAKHGASNMRVSGSVARGAARPDSDIDFLADGLENSLEPRVDLVSPEDLHGYLRDQILNDSIVV